MTADRSAARHTRSRPAIGDVVWVGLLAAAMFGAVLAGFGRVSPYIVHYSTWDFWFESDPPAVADQLWNRWGRNHLRTSHHPLFSILLFPLVQMLRWLPGATSETVFGLLVASVAGIWIGVIFLTLRSFGLRPVDAVVFSALSAASASAVFWFAVLEAPPFGALSIVLAIAVVAVAQRGWTPPTWACLLVSLATLAFTSTNWMVGLLMLAAVLPWRRALRTAAASLGIAGLLWGIQRLVFPTAGSPLSLHTPAELDYLFNKEAFGVLQKSFVFFFHAIALPELGSAYGFRLSVQAMRPGDGGPLAASAVAVWVLLLLLTAWSLWRAGGSRTTIVLLFAVLGQWVLALVFGVETFMYSIHWAPLLVLLTAMSAQTARGPAVALAAALVLLAGLNNILKFDVAAERLKERYEDERQFSLAVAMLTDRDDLILCGRHPLAAVGEPVPPLAVTLGTPPGDVVLEDDPDTCFYRFDGPDEQRRGWILPYEHWSIGTIEAFRRAGARYFVTPYSYGIERSADLFRLLDERYRRLGDWPKARLYDLAGPDRANPLELTDGAGASSPTQKNPSLGLVNPQRPAVPPADPTGPSTSAREIQ